MKQLQQEETKNQRQREIQEKKGHRSMKIKNLSYYTTTLINTFIGQPQFSYGNI